MITKKDLENYIALDKCIKATKKKIEYYENKCPYAIHGKVSGSSSQFPYIERTYAVDGGGFKSGGMTEEKRRQRIQNLQFKLRKQLRDYEDKRLEIEEFIADIKDPKAKLLFTYLYVDGMSQEEAGELFEMEQSSVSRKINRYINRYLISTK